MPQTSREIRHTLHKMELMQIIQSDCVDLTRLTISINRKRRVIVCFSINIFKLNKLDLALQVDSKQGIKTA